MPTQGVAVSEADRQKIEAVSNRNAAAYEAWDKRRLRCEKDTPPESFFARRFSKEELAVLRARKRELKEAIGYTS